MVYRLSPLFQIALHPISKSKCRVIALLWSTPLTTRVFACSCVRIHDLCCLSLHPSKTHSIHLRVHLHRTLVLSLPLSDASVVSKLTVYTSKLTVYISIEQSTSPSNSLDLYTSKLTLYISKCCDVLYRPVHHQVSDIYFRLRSQSDVHIQATASRIHSSNISHSPTLQLPTSKHSQSAL